MPRGDGTGPAGYGSMAGRGLGFCAGYNVPGYAHPGFVSRPGIGRGRAMRYGGRGLGLGYGAAYRWGVVPTYLGHVRQAQDVTDSTQALKLEASYLKSLLETVGARLTEIDGALKSLGKSGSSDREDDTGSK